MQTQNSARSYSDQAMLTLYTMLVHRYPESQLMTPSWKVPVAFMATVTKARSGFTHVYCSMPLLIHRKVCGSLMSTLPTPGSLSSGHRWLTGGRPCIMMIRLRSPPKKFTSSWKKVYSVKAS